MSEPDVFDKLAAQEQAQAGAGAPITPPAVPEPAPAAAEAQAAQSAGLWASGATVTPDVGSRAQAAHAPAHANTPEPLQRPQPMTLPDMLRHGDFGPSGLQRLKGLA